MKLLRRARDGCNVTAIPRSSLGVMSPFWFCLSQDVKSKGRLEHKARDSFEDRRRYRAQLDQEVLHLQKQLQEENNLHIALTNATGDNNHGSLVSSCDVPYKVMELLSSVEALEIAVSKLEDELVYLQLKLSEEKNERHVTENLLEHHRRLSCSSLSCSSSYSWDEKISSLWSARCHHKSLSLLSTLGPGHLSSNSTDKLDDAFTETTDSETYREVSGTPALSSNDNIFYSTKVKSDNLRNGLSHNPNHHPNELSEQMVQCMRSIFLSFSKQSTTLWTKPPSICVPYSSPVTGLLTRSSTTYPNYSVITSPSQTSYLSSSNDHCRVQDRVNQASICRYHLAIEVTEITVGKKQLEYAAEALQRFRYFVRQLENVNPALMSCTEKLAFWINLYNALIMHAYLAYGVPKTDKKLFVLMKKASYNIGGSKFSALDIEYNILKLKPPAHLPPMSLIMALHHVHKLSEEQQQFAVDEEDPLVLFALSWGMHSSPAVRIFTANNVKMELQNALRDYIQASFGIDRKGRLMVPKLLYSYAKRMIEDSLLVDWISRFLNPEQLSLVQGRKLQTKHGFLGARTFSVLAFNSSFRFLFLPERNEQ